MARDRRHSHERREALASRAFWIVMALFGLSILAAGAAAHPSHARRMFDTPQADQAAGLAASGGPHGLRHKLAPARPSQDLGAGAHPAMALAPAQGVAPLAFSKRAAWDSAAFDGSPARAHHYSATGPPGYQPS
jgi:hypothetical protein